MDYKSMDNGIDRYLQCYFMEMIIEGYEVSVVPFDVFIELVQKYKAQDLGWPVCTEWLGEDNPPVYSLDANPCFLGFLVNNEGKVKLFHFYQTETKEQRISKFGGNVTGGVFTTGRSGLKKELIKSYVLTHKLKFLNINKFIRSKDEFVSAHLLIVPNEKRVVFAFGKRSMKITEINAMRVRIKVFLEENGFDEM